MIISGNPVLASLRGPPWSEIHLVVSKSRLSGGHGLCFPEEDRIPLSSNSISQPSVTWDWHRCHSCGQSCGQLKGYSIDCDYGSGQCRCPLGRSGPECLSSTAEVAVEPAGQEFICPRGNGVDDTLCVLNVIICLRSPAAGESATRNIASLTLHDGCWNSSAKSNTCVASFSNADTDFHVNYTGKVAVNWAQAGSRCGTLAVPISVKPGKPFEPLKQAVLHVGYHPSPSVYPDALLDGTLVDPPVTPSLAIFPWCIHSGDCRRLSPVEVRLTILGREEHCPPGWFSRPPRMPRLR